MKFGRVSFRKKADELPSQNPAQPQTVNPPQSGLGQQTNNPTQQNTQPSPGIPQSQDKKKPSLFKGLSDAETPQTVFSSLQDVQAYKKLRNTEWREEYSSRLPKKPNFYRYIGYDKNTGQRTHFLLIRGDKPNHHGLYRVVIDKFGHAGNAKARYFNSAMAVKDYVRKLYDGIDADALEFGSMDTDALRKDWVEYVRDGGAQVINRLAEVNIGSEAQNKHFIEQVIREALTTTTPGKAIDILKVVKERGIVDLSDLDEQFSRFTFNFKDHKDEYKQRFDEKVPYPTKDTKTKKAILNFADAMAKEHQTYKQMMKDIDIPKTGILNRTNHDVEVTDIYMPGDRTPRTVVIPADDYIVLPREVIDKSDSLGKLESDEKVVMTNEEGLYMNDLSDYLKKMNGYSYALMQIASEIAQTSSSVKVEVKNNTGQDFLIDDYNYEITIPANSTVILPSNALNTSKQLRAHFADGDLTTVKEVEEKWTGFIGRDNLKKLTDYVNASAKSYQNYEGKGLRPFEHNLNMYTSPSVNWRSITDSTFRAELDQGDIYVPAPKDYMNQGFINEHFGANEAIAFGYVHEIFHDDKKIWVVDEFQSDLVQQIGNLSDSPESKTWYNSKGKSRKQKFKSTVENYYKEWHKVFLNKLIKKAKALDVDEIWVIHGEDIFDYWIGRGANNDTIQKYKDAKEGGDRHEIAEAKEKALQLDRRIYDNTAVEYAQYTNPEKYAELKKEYDDTIKQINMFYDLKAKVDKATVFYNTINSEVSEETKQQSREALERMGLQNISLEQMEDDMNKIDVHALRERLNAILDEISVTKKKTRGFPVEVYNGKYHVIDVNKVPDEKLAKKENYNEWIEKAYKWITEYYIPQVYLPNAEQRAEPILSESEQKRIGLEWFWEREIPRELKTDAKLLVAIRDGLRAKFNQPDLNYSDHINLYIEGVIFTPLYKRSGDNQDPSYPDAQTSPMEENFGNRLVDPSSPLYRKRKGRGAIFGDPDESGDLRTNLPASVLVKKTATDVVERYMINREKQHASPEDIKEELEDKGVSEQVIEETYDTRDKNLYKETK